MAFKSKQKNLTFSDFEKSLRTKKNRSKETFKNLTSYASKQIRLCITANRCNYVFIYRGIDAKVKNLEQYPDWAYKEG